MTKAQQEQVNSILRAGGLDFTAEVAQLRSAFEGLRAGVALPDDVECNGTVIGGVDAIEVSVRDSAPTGVVVYFHGGVYVIGSASSSVALVSDIARRAGAKAITVDYRLAPEYPYPAAVDDAQSVYRGLLEKGVDPNRIAFAGDSAGGGLAVAAMLALRDAGAPLPACGFLMSPYADLTLSGASVNGKQAEDLVLTEEGVRLRIDDYVAGADARDPYISPVFADLKGLPPLLIQVGSHEILLSDALRLAERAAMADVEVALEVTPGAPHVFQGFAAMLDEAAAALDRAAAFLKAHLGATDPLPVG